MPYPFFFHMTTIHAFSPLFARVPWFRSPVRPSTFVRPLAPRTLYLRRQLCLPAFALLACSSFSTFGSMLAMTDFPRIAKLLRALHFRDDGRSKSPTLALSTLPCQPPPPLRPSPLLPRNSFSTRCQLPLLHLPLGRLSLSSSAESTRSTGSPWPPSRVSETSTRSVFPPPSLLLVRSPLSAVEGQLANRAAVGGLLSSFFRRH